MTTTDKHPPVAKPKYKPAAPIHKARTDPYFGTVIRKADGAKTIRPGDGNKPHTREAYTTTGMEYDGMLSKGVIPMDRVMQLQSHYRKKMKYFETY